MNWKFLIVSAAFSGLIGCDSSSRQENGTTLQQGTRAVRGAGVELPPAIVGGHTYRCADNTVVAVDFLEGDKIALLHRPESTQPLRLTAEQAGAPFQANGYRVSGSGKAIILESPGKAPQPCKGQ